MFSTIDVDMRSIVNIFSLHHKMESRLADQDCMGIARTGIAA